MNKPLLKKFNSLGSQARRMLLLAAAWLLTVCAYAQTTVTGRILSGEDSSPLPGVNIIVKGTSTGTISDADGNFSLGVPASDATLVFSFVGYLSQEVELAGRSTLSIVLATDAKQCLKLW